MPDSQDSSTFSSSSQALVLWKPKYLFLPPVQETPAIHVFRHIDLEDRPQIEQENQSAPRLEDDSHIPDHETSLPPLILNETFLRTLLRPTHALPLPMLSYPTDQDNQDTPPPTQDTILTHSQNDQDIFMLEQATVLTEVDIPMMEAEEPTSMDCVQSSLESIDENPVVSPASSALTSSAPPEKFIKSKTKTQKITLKRKTPEPTHSFSAGQSDVFSTSANQDDLEVGNSQKLEVGNSQKERERKRCRSSSSDPDEEASVTHELAQEQEQWRVGKMPGHQGSHFRSPKKLKVKSETASPEMEGSADGKKRTFNQSITGNAERVLKKPFRPPTRITSKADHLVAEANDRSTISFSPSKTSPMLSKSAARMAASTAETSFCPEFDAIFTTKSPSSSSSSSSSSRSRKSKPSSSRASKPFKVPTRQDRSFAPSPSSKSGQAQARGETASAPTPTSEHARIVALQNEIMETKKALKIVADNDEEQIKELIHTWRNAGREIVERLFRDVPESDCPLTPSTAGSRSASGRYNPYQSGDFSRGGRSSSLSSNYWSSPDDTPILTPEQAEYLKNAPRNADGEPVDEDGNLLIPDSGDEAKFWDELKDERRFGNNEKYQGGWSRRDDQGRLNGMDESDSMNRELVSSSSSSVEVDFEVKIEWNYAALMRMMNVDPDLLGYDESTEEWIEFEQA